MNLGLHMLFDSSLNRKEGTRGPESGSVPDAFNDADASRGPSLQSQRHIAGAGILETAVANDVAMLLIKSESLKLANVKAVLACVNLCNKGCSTLACCGGGGLFLFGEIKCANSGGRRSRDLLWKVNEDRFQSLHNRVHRSSNGSTGHRLGLSERCTLERVELNLG